MLKNYPLHVDPKNRAELFSCLSFETIFHLNPNWEFSNESIDEIGNFSFSIEDYATEEQFDITGHYLQTESTIELQLTHPHIQALALHYNDEAQTIHAEVEYTSNEISEETEALIVYWLRAIQAYLRLYISKTPYTLFHRILMNTMVLKMSPSQRKISLMIYRFTLLEILVILILVIGYFFFVL
jgi:hypothetical protein